MKIKEYKIIGHYTLSQFNMRKLDILKKKTLLKKSTIVELLITNTNEKQLKKLIKKANEKQK